MHWSNEFHDSFISKCVRGRHLEHINVKCHVLTLVVNFLTIICCVTGV